MANEDFDTQQDDFEDEDEKPETEDSNESDGDGDSDNESNDSGDKRVRELQSLKDKETARANKLAKELAALKARNGGASDDPDVAARNEEIRELHLDAVYGEFPELKTFGVDRSAISGDTRAEMRETATALVGLIKSIETKARNAALREHGITPAPTGARKEPKKDFSSMSAEDIEKEIARVKAGGRDPIW